MEYLIIDGYNVIGNWPELKRLSAASLEDAREKLVEILAEYQAFTGKQIIIVFDAYRSKGRKETENRPGIEIRYRARSDRRYPHRKPGGPVVSAPCCRGRYFRLGATANRHGQRRQALVQPGISPGGAQSRRRDIQRGGQDSN